MNNKNYTRIAKNASLLYFRMLLTMGVSLYTSRVVLKTLGVEDYGIYSIVAGFVTVFGFLLGAMSSATQRFLSYEMGKAEDKDVSGIFSMSMNIHILLSFVIFLLGETVGLWFLNNKLNIPIDRLQSAKWVYHLAIISLMVTVVSVPYNALIIAHENMGVFAKVSILDVILKLMVVFVLTIFDSDKLKLYATLNLFVVIIIFLVYQQYNRAHYRESVYKKYWNKNLFKELFSYTGWSLWGNIAHVLSTQGVNILLNIFFGPAVNAAREVAIQASSALNRFVQSIQVAVNPQIVKSYASGHMDYMYQLVCYGAKYNLFILIVLSSPVLANTHTVLKIWLTVVPLHADSFLQLIIVNVIIDSVSAPLVISAQATGKIKLYQIVVGGILLFNIPFSYLLLQKGAEPKHVFYVGIVISIIALASRLIILKKLIDLPYLKFIKEVILRGLLIISISILLSITINEIFIPKPNFYLESINVIISTIIAICFFGFDDLEKKFFISKLKLILKKIR